MTADVFKLSPLGKSWQQQQPDCTTSEGGGGGGVTSPRAALPRLLQAVTRSANSCGALNIRPARRVEGSGPVPGLQPGSCSRRTLRAAGRCTAQGIARLLLDSAAPSSSAEGPPLGPGHWDEARARTPAPRALYPEGTQLRTGLLFAQTQLAATHP
ncbi:hypothetical protein SKAU_G00034490 [Synaphobranchus kaupii]|uniref:Uncharacterized protein n=1 Tax=Synaphobranchus kaupii TaxID=118154 RepID=A0A9Q1GFQ0_SYNKA|nr:hypothetical protein SKAU_G00034490 [Synaphobranchus kaupii]